MTVSEPPTTSASVIVCAYTDERWHQLVHAVTSASEQLLDGDELIVVIDHNAALHERAVAEFDGCASVIVNEGAQGLSDARNSGVAAAGGELAVFLDDDAEARSGWLNELRRPFANPRVVGTGGIAEPIWDAGRPTWMPDEFLWVVGCSYVGLPKKQEKIRNPIGCTMAFRASAIRTVGGFAGELGRVGKRPMGCEETDLAMKITASESSDVIHCPDAVVQHHVSPERCTVSYFVRRCYMEGRSKAILASLHGAAGATEAERTYLRTLARGMARSLTHPRELARAAAIALGFVTTAAGFALGTAMQRVASK